jgi:hypothetical protein
MVPRFLCQALCLDRAEAGLDDPTVRPSETEQGLSWLENFQPEERHAAELLINSIRVISSTSFRAYLTELLTQSVSEFQAPVVFYPVRELPSYLPGVLNPLKRKVEVELTPDGDAIPLFPLDDPFEPLPGSEGIVGNIIRDVIGHWPNYAVASSPKTLQKLREVRPRTILLVDDYSGTGTRVTDYVDSWMRNPTIRSWYSYGLIRFHVVLITASGAALEKMKRHPRITGIKYRERATDFSTATWSDDERNKITALCTKYAYNSRWEFGYKSAAGLLVMQHTVPNNLPAILWQSTFRRKPDWNPFFAARRMTPTLQIELDDYKLEVDATEIANSIGQFRLGVALSEQPNPTVRVLLLVLAAAAQRKRAPESLSEILQTSLVAAEQTIQACKNLALLDQQGRLTDLGRNELRRARARGDEIQPTQLKGSTRPYYPTQLRGVGEI